jgi:hypothetical protein
LLCSADSGGFEPEAGHKLHGDIEYYYRLYLINKQGGSLAENPTWEIEIFTTHNDECENSKEMLSGSDLMLLQPRIKLPEVLEKFTNKVKINS